MHPVIALVGRPNVGKSTLFNRVTKSRDALVADFSGLTRDRQYGEASVDGRKLILIDTGGISGNEAGIDSEMAKQSRQAIIEADVVLFMVDARAGLTPADEDIARELRSLGKPFMLVVNKVDGINTDLGLAEFYRLGTDNIHPITATHGRGVRQLLDSVLALLPEEEEGPSNDDAGIRIGVVGRPNVGKSTLVNRLLGEERVVVYDQPGTTRDSIYIRYERHGKPYTLIDTAGVRRRKNIKETVERFSIVKTLKAIDDAHVVVLVLDAREGVVDQDLHLLGQIINAGRGLVIALNKWDGMTEDQKRHVRNTLERRLTFIDYAPVHFISALHGTGVGNLYKSIDRAYSSSTQKLSTNELTGILAEAVFDHPPPMINRHRIKLRYAHSGGSNPPTVVIHGNQADKVPDHYRRYLEKVFRQKLGLSGTPVKLQFRTSANPYADKSNRPARQPANKRQGSRRFAKPSGAVGPGRKGSK